jgi:hypothetical protein
MPAAVQARRDADFRRFRFPRRVASGFRITRRCGSAFRARRRTRLQQLACANGKDAEQLVKDAVAKMLESQTRFLSGVKRASSKLTGVSL